MSGVALVWLQSSSKAASRWRRASAAVNWPACATVVPRDCTRWPPGAAKTPAGQMPLVAGTVLGRVGRVVAPAAPVDLGAGPLAVGLLAVGRRATLTLTVRQMAGQVTKST